ncbi:MAG: NAD(P)-dependent oxidoreductase [Lentisphaeria bacterium]|nr:NAD(P)-dependent oxidoreductase [Lentisphaeria bacterium]
MKKNVLVTGAAGYIGQCVVKALLDSGADVLAVDLRPAGGVDSRARYVATDIFTSPLDELFAGRVPDACCHLAWQDGFRHNSPYHMGAVSQHYDLMRRLAECGVGQIAVMGTMHEIGYHEGAVTAETPCRPQSLYGIAKNALREALMREFADSGICFQWLRGFYLFGNDGMNHSVFTKMLEAEEAGAESFPLSSGHNRCDFIAIDSFAEQIAACLMQTEVQGIINCCSGVATPFRDVVDFFIRDRKLTIRPDYGAFPDRPYDSPAIWGDPEPIDRILRAAGKERRFFLQA